MRLSLTTSQVMLGLLYQWMSASKGIWARENLKGGRIGGLSTTSTPFSVWTWRGFGVTSAIATILSAATALAAGTLSKNSRLLRTRLSAKI